MPHEKRSKRAGILAAATVAAVGVFGAAPVQAAEFKLGGERCDLIEVPTSAPAGTGPCDGVRPGALVESRAGFCTLNFRFDGADGRRYIGTAGHCILGEETGERSWRPGKGPTARDGDGDRIGRFAYAALRGEKDFALIRLGDGVRAKSAMCSFGGPTGTYDGRGSATRVLSHYGLGIGVGDVLPARSMVAAGTPDPDHVFAQGVVIPGDSGGPVTLDADGRAVGLTVTTGVHAGSIGGGGVDAGTVGITRIRPQVERAERVLDARLRIQRAPQR